MLYDLKVQNKEQALQFLKMYLHDYGAWLNSNMVAALNIAIKELEKNETFYFN